MRAKAIPPMIDPTITPGLGAFEDSDIERVTTGRIGIVR